MCDSKGEAVRVSGGIDDRYERREQSSTSRASGSSFPIRRHPASSRSTSFNQGKYDALDEEGVEPRGDSEGKQDAMQLLLGIQADIRGSS